MVLKEVGLPRATFAAFSFVGTAQLTGYFLSAGRSVPGFFAGRNIHSQPGRNQDELNQRIPLRFARGQRHLNFCEAPEDRIKDYQAAPPKFWHVRF
jgi:hypothetical protein